MGQQVVGRGAERQLRTQKANANTADVAVRAPTKRNPSIAGLAAGGGPARLPPRRAQVAEELVGGDAEGRAGRREEHGEG